VAALALIVSLLHGQDTDEASATPKKSAHLGKTSPSPSATPSPRKKKKSQTPRPAKTPAKAKADSSDEAGEDKPTASARPSKSPSPGSKPKAGKKKGTAKPSAGGEKSPSKKTRSPEREKTPRPHPRPSPGESATPRAPQAIAVPQPSEHPPPSASPPPAPDTTGQLTISKSGYEENQVPEPPPPPPPKRFWFWPWSRSRSSGERYRFLTRSVIEEIRRAPVMSNRWKFIVVHNSGTRQGNARVFDYYHRRVRRMQNGLAYHFVIGNGTSTGNGEIEVGDRWRRQINGGHVHSDFLNNIALGICLVGDFNRDRPTQAQLLSCEELIRYLRERCGKADGRPIPVRPHREMNPPRWATDCPGDAFPYSWFRRF
jgi:hypothetical protein